MERYTFVFCVVIGDDDGSGQLVGQLHNCKALCAANDLSMWNAPSVVFCSAACVHVRVCPCTRVCILLLPNLHVVSVKFVFHYSTRLPLLNSPIVDPFDARPVEARVRRTDCHTFRVQCVDRKWNTMIGALKTSVNFIELNKYIHIGRCTEYTRYTPLW